MLEKPFSCQFCDKKFRFSVLVKNHEEREHELEKRANSLDFRSSIVSSTEIHIVSKLRKALSKKSIVHQTSFSLPNVHELLFNDIVWSKRRGYAFISSFILNLFHLRFIHSLYVHLFLSLDLDLLCCILHFPFYFILFYFILFYFILFYFIHSNFNIIQFLS